MPRSTKYNRRVEFRLDDETMDLLEQTTLEQAGNGVTPNAYARALLHVALRNPQQQAVAAELTVMVSGLRKQLTVAVGDLLDEHLPKILKALVSNKSRRS